MILKEQGDFGVEDCCSVLLLAGSLHVFQLFSLAVDKDCSSSQGEFPLTFTSM